jgi:hypothetical protein
VALDRMLECGQASRRAGNVGADRDGGLLQRGALAGGQQQSQPVVVGVQDVVTLGALRAGALDVPTAVGAQLAQVTPQLGDAGLVVGQVGDLPELLRRQPAVAALGERDQDPHHPLHRTALITTSRLRHLTHPIVVGVVCCDRRPGRRPDRGPSLPGGSGPFPGAVESAGAVLGAGPNL